MTKKPLYKSLYVQVLTAIVIGVLIGNFYPETGAAMKPLGDGFIKLIKMIIAPVIREGAIREIKDPRMSGGKRYEEEDFMGLWFPLIDKCKVMVLDGDWNYSRNSIWEMMRGVLIQAGEIPSRPMADMDVLHLDGRPVTLHERAEKMAEMLKYQLGKDFEPREAARQRRQYVGIAAAHRHVLQERLEWDALVAL